MLDTRFHVYVAARPLNAARVTLAVGEPFALQDKAYIRGLGRAFGVLDAETRPFGELDYVKVVPAHKVAF